MMKSKGDNTKKLKVFLANRGNPDFGQHHHLPMPDTKSDYYVEVQDFAEASKVCRDYINEFALGGGHWTGGKILQDKKEIARVSYNGSVWPPGKWDMNVRALYEPGEAPEKNNEVMTVYVVAWRSDGSGGFDWYHDAAAADRAFDEEKKHADEFNGTGENWTAYRIDVEVGASKPKDITNEIDAELDNLCENAKIKYPVPVFTAETQPLRCEAMHSGLNPQGIRLEGGLTGDPGIYQEIRISAFKGADCIGDILVGLDESGELRVMVTADGDGDDDHQVLIFPQRSAENAVVFDQVVAVPTSAPKG